MDGESADQIFRTKRVSSCRLFSLGQSTFHGQPQSIFSQLSIVVILFLVVGILVAVIHPYD